MTNGLLRDETPTHIHKSENISNINSYFTCRGSRKEKISKKKKIKKLRATNGDTPHIYYWWVEFFIFLFPRTTAVSARGGLYNTSALWLQWADSLIRPKTDLKLFITYMDILHSIANERFMRSPRSDECPAPGNRFTKSTLCIGNWHCLVQIGLFYRAGIFKYITLLQLLYYQYVAEWVKNVIYITWYQRILY